MLPETPSCPRVLCLLSQSPAEAAMLEDSLQTLHRLWIPVHRGGPVAAGSSRMPGTNDSPRLRRVGSSLPADPRGMSASEPHPQACFLGGGFCHLRAIRRQRGAAAAVCIPAAGAGWTHDLSGHHSTVHNQWLLKIKVKATGGRRADGCSGGQLVTVMTSAMTMPLMRGAVNRCDHRGHV